MTEQPQSTTSSPFDAVRHESDEYGEYWSGRELCKLLGYSRWGKFKETIDRAKKSCEEAGEAVSDHMHLEVHMIKTGKNAKREVDDIYLSRYACYLTLQNADPNGKPIVGLAQTYFAVQTRRQELADDETLSTLPENQKRLIFRNQMALLNQQLATAAQKAGVIQPSDFSTFQNHGYRGLYGGETENDIHARKRLKPQDKILDYMGSDELIANAFRASLAKQKIEREQIQDKHQANIAHHEMGQEVRATIIRAGATLPEELPTPAKSIKQLAQEEQRRLKQQGQLNLFDQAGEEQ